MPLKSNTNIKTTIPMIPLMVIKYRLIPTDAAKIATSNPALLKTPSPFSKELTVISLIFKNNSLPSPRMSKAPPTGKATLTGHIGTSHMVLLNSARLKESRA